MRVDILSIFPAMFEAPFGASIVKRAQEKGAVEIFLHDIRDFATDKHRSVDDIPYGGGAGMVMKPEPLVAAIESIKPAGPNFRRVLMCAQGRKFTQAVAGELSQLDHLLLVCGRYEGIDERVREGWIDDEICIGDYIVSGGEIPAMVVVDAVTRILPGVLGNPESLAEESFTSGMLEYPQYTRPEVFRGLQVPEVLRNGHHGKIVEWRSSESRKRTLDRRPDLLDKARLQRSEKE